VIRALHPLRALPPAIASLLVLLLPGQAVAAGWSASHVVAAAAADTGVGSADLVALRGSTAVAVYTRSTGYDTRSVYARRSMDAGGTWQAPILLSDHGSSPAAAGHGSNVEVVWLWDGRVRYARSTDSGGSYSAAVALSPADARASDATVAHGADGLVVVAWAQSRSTDPDYLYPKVKVRVSTDAGSSFGPSRAVVAGGYSARVAAGNGVIYVFYSKDWETLLVRRSLDLGRTWDSPVKIGWSWGAYDVAARGDQAYIVYEGESRQSAWALRFSRTSDRGAHWSPAGDMLAGSWGGYSPIVSVDAGGTARAVFEPCSVDWDICDEWGAVFYVESRNGSTWSSPKPIHPPQPRRYNSPEAIAVGSRVMVVYHSCLASHADRLYLVSRPR
jgi:hypothetical protein